MAGECLVSSTFSDKITCRESHAMYHITRSVQGPEFRRQSKFDFNTCLLMFYQSDSMARFVRDSGFRRIKGRLKNLFFNVF